METERVFGRCEAIDATETHLETSCQFCLRDDCDAAFAARMGYAFW